MKSYLVTWKIDIEADTPEEAAMQALIIHRDTESAAQHFSVTDCEANKTYSIDLSNERSTFEKELAPEDQVFWTDPDNGIGNGYFFIRSIDREKGTAIIYHQLEAESEREVFLNELS